MRELKSYRSVHDLPRSSPYSGPHRRSWRTKLDWWLGSWPSPWGSA